MSARGGWISSFSGLPRPVPSTGSWNSLPSYSSGPSRASALRTISTYSRVRETGRANDTPCQPSDTCGPDTPSPSRKRPLGERVERGRGHGRHRGRAGGDLEQPRAEADPLGHRAQVAEHRGRVLAPRLGHPHGVEALAVGELRQLDLLLGGEPGPVGEDRGRCARCNPMRRAEGGSHQPSSVAAVAAPAAARLDARHGVGARVRRSSAPATSRSRCARPAAPTATAPGTPVPLGERGEGDADGGLPQPPHRPRARAARAPTGRCCRRWCAGRTTSRPRACATSSATRRWRRWRGGRACAASAPRSAGAPRSSTRPTRRSCSCASTASW